MESESMVIVKTRYLLRRGTTSDVGGMMSSSSRKKRVKASIIEIERVIFSIELEDSKKTRIVRNAMLAQGTISETM
jgi:hypothetical protein